MSKERALRRAEREREQAIKVAARAAEQERRERREARRRALTGWLPRPRWQPGILARRRRRNVALTVGVLVVLNVWLWIAVDDAATRAGGVVVSILAAPVLHVLLFSRR